MIEIRAAINTGSVAGQCPERRSIELCIAEVVKCITALQPKFSASTATLTYDPTIEQQSLGMGEPLIASLNRLTDKQVSRQWFLYTRNRARKANAEFVECEITGVAGSINVAVAREIAYGCSHWISFPQASIFRCGRIEVRVDGVRVESIANAERETTVLRWIPRFEPSPKHKLYEYQSANGLVSRMDLDDVAAGAVLSRSIFQDAGLRFGLSKGTYYAFRLTRWDDGQAVFHGYVVEVADIPAETVISLSRLR